MQKNSEILPVAVLSIFLVFILSSTAFALVLSGGGHFAVSNNSLYINHTNDFNQNTTINATTTSLVVLNIGNSSTGISNFYQQPFQNPFCTSISRLTPKITSTLGPNNTVDIEQLKNESIGVTIASNAFTCYPGRWFGGINVTNSTDVTDFTVFNLTVDIPITSSTTAFNITTGGASIFNGTLPANSNTFHSYFFNTSAFVNISAVSVNLKGLGDLDVFLLDSSGSLVGKSIGDDIIKSIFKKLSGENSFWEIRIYGNTSSSGYNGTLLLSALNVTNSASFSSYGVMTPLTTNSTNANVENPGSLPMINLSESSEIYAVKTFAVINGTKEFPLLVPSFAERIKVSVNWTVPGALNATNYSVSLTVPNGTLIATSVDHQLNANITGVELEEFVETRTIQGGIWNITVFNSSISYGIMNNYTVTAKIFLDESEWISSNFSSLVNKTLDFVGSGNWTRKVQVNLTVPRNSIDGSYEGYIGYSSLEGIVTRMPLSFSVGAGSIIVNRTFNSSTYAFNENMGQNFIRTLNITFNNTGSKDLVFTNISTGNLFLVSNNLRNIPLAFEAGPSPIAARDNRIINITLNVSTTLTSDAQGIYEGWIFINSTDSYPSQGHNLTIRMNLTNSIELPILSLISKDSISDQTMNNTAAAENFTIRFQMNYPNGILISDIDGQKFNTANFTVFMRHANISTRRIPSSGSLTLSNSTSSGIIYSDASDRFDINITVPRDILGGLYELVLGGTNDLFGVSYSGTTTLNYLTVANSSLLMSSNVSGCSIGSTSCTSSKININEGNTVTVSSFIKNYGTITSLPLSLNFSESCSTYTVVPLSENCTGTGVKNGQEWNNLVPVAGETCYVSWKVTGSTVGSACTGNIQGTPSNMWFSSNGVNFNIGVSVVSNSSSSEGSSSSASSSKKSTTTTTTSNPKYLEISKWTSNIGITQGKSKSSSVTVRNVNDILNQNVVVSVPVLTKEISTFVFPGSTKINTGKTLSYTVTFSVPESMEIGEYPGKFQASGTKATKEVDFVVSVLPGEAKKIEINKTFVELENDIFDLWNDISSAKSSGVNVSSAESAFNKLKTKIDEAEASIALGTDGGYLAASHSFKEIRDLLNTTKAQLISDKKEGGGSVFPVNPLYIGIGAAVAVAVFLAYLFLPFRKPGNMKSGAKINFPSNSGGPESTTTKQKLSVFSQKAESKTTKEELSGFMQKIKSSKQGSMKIGFGKFLARGKAEKKSDIFPSINTEGDKFKKLQEKIRSKKKKYKYQG